MLHRNRGEWLKSCDIAASVGIRNSADVRHICQELTDEYGVWVIGDRAKGFQLAENWEDFVAHQMANLRQALTTFDRVKARVGEPRFKREVVALKAREALGLME